MLSCCSFKQEPVLVVVVFVVDVIMYDLVNHVLLSFMNLYHKCSVDIIFLLPKKSQWFFSNTYVLNSSSFWVLHNDNEADDDGESDGDDECDDDGDGDD